MGLLLGDDSPSRFLSFTSLHIIGARAILNKISNDEQKRSKK